MELRQLKYFLAVADHRSFISAANDLFLSRQAVSKAVSQLEQELGVELFMRDTSGAFLTPAGMSFYERIRGPVMELNQARAEMQQYGPRYQQMIRAAFSVGTLGLFEPVLQDFLQEQKNIVVDYWECSPDECESLLANRDADIAISITPFSAPRIRAQILYRAPLGILLKDRDAAGGLDTLELSDLHWSPLACLRDGQCDILCSKHRLTPQYSGTDILRLITMAKSGRCSALLPQILVPDYITGVRYVPLADAPAWTIQLGYPESLEHNTLFQMALDELMTSVFNTSK